MDGSDAAGGIELTIFDGVDEFCEMVASGLIVEDDRRIHGDHPLISIVENVLEPWSNNHLGEIIVGMTRASMRRLDQQRLSLEGPPNMEPAKQRLLYAFSAVIEVFRSTSYGQAPIEDSLIFFDDAFPSWLEQLASWAKDASLPDLEERVERARVQYSTVQGRIVALGTSGFDQEG